MDAVFNVKKVVGGTSEVVAAARKIIGVAAYPDGTNAGTVLVYKGCKATSGNEIAGVRVPATASDSIMFGAPVDFDPPPVVAQPAGTVATTAGSATVTGTTTTFTTDVVKGQKIRIGKYDYIVSAIGSNTSLTLAENAKETLSGVGYWPYQDGILIVPTGTALMGWVYWS